MNFWFYVCASLEQGVTWTKQRNIDISQDTEALK